MGTRRKARVRALQALFEIDSVGHDRAEVLGRRTEEEPPEEEAVAFVKDLVEGVLVNKVEIDGIIALYAPAWPVPQMALIDRNILRLAIFEILFNNKVPVKVVINEAVELAKMFGGDNTPKFINGVLGTVSAQSGKKRR
ncbi:MAG: transcription antitermination factor NusB [Dehalococcoidia bacterium]